MSPEKIMFTGNWYFDCGIIGFLSVIDDLYGEREVERILNELEIREIDGTFQFDDKTNLIFFKSFWFSYMKDQIFKHTNIDQKIRDEFLEELKRASLNSGSIDEFICMTNCINKSFNEKTKKRLVKRNMSGFYINFAFFNCGEKTILEESKRYFFNYHSYIQNDKTQNNSSITAIIDKTVNKFLVSYREFRNEFFDRPMSIEELERMLGLPLHIFLVCVEKGFVKFEEVKENIFVHTPDLMTTWKIHKGLKVLKERLVKKGRKDYSIFSLVANSLVDILYERKSEWVLKNVLVITHGGIKNQDIFNVNFFPLDKTTACLLRDEIVRRRLLFSLEIKRGNGTQKINGLEGLIHKKPLSPIIVDYLIQSVNRKESESKKLDKDMIISFLHFSTVDIFNSEYYRPLEQEVTQDPNDVYRKKFIEISKIYHIFSHCFQINTSEARNLLFSFLREAKILDKYNFINNLLKITHKGIEDGKLKITGDNFNFIMNYALKVVEVEEVLPYMIPLILAFYTQSFSGMR